jgi:hypothetical protein
MKKKDSKRSAKQSKAELKKLARSKPKTQAKVMTAKAGSVKKSSSRFRLTSKPNRPRSDDADAFLRVRRNGRRTKDDLADELGAVFVGSATSGEEQGVERRDTVLEEESGGPFVTTPAKREFAPGFDASNPQDAEREPFPSAQSQPDLQLQLDPIDPPIQLET